ncbi:hypothetical protein LTR78_000375 [Recurvomyces mirabilis]|uniref:Carbohydrate-binding module family 18 protein n=1 Tax=Recurvomyces mirabilis TaxID=574656 RepID=A0AAE1C6I6_9PEZI|nr:hypothetical protein LTR78_000375 [Recurvomyces mirabilis]
MAENRSFSRRTTGGLFICTLAALFAIYVHIQSCADPAHAHKLQTIVSRSVSSINDGLGGGSHDLSYHSTNVSLARRDDYSCGPGNPCRNGACCGEGGYCGYGSTYCGNGCSSNCDATAECGKDAKESGQKCPLNTCCSQYGFCGTTSDFCGTKCQSNCVEHPTPPSGGSSTGILQNKVIGYYESWANTLACHKVAPTDLPLDALTHVNYAFAYIDPSMNWLADKISQPLSLPIPIYPLTILHAEKTGWEAQGGVNSTQACSDCWLGAQALQLGNPLGYDQGQADNFASLTSSCSSNQYSYATPTAYALNATDTAPSASPTSAPGCTGSYYVQATDTCFDLSQYLNVSTYNLLVYNGWDMYCRNFNASVGTSFCSPPTCNTYTWQVGDTCNAVVLANPSITLTQFMSWNPNFDPLCQNAGNFVGYEVCLSPPGGILTPTATSDLGGGVSSAPTAAVPVPSNAMDGSNRNCGKWYNIVSGDECGTVSVGNGITLDDFYFLNPEINTQCTNLLLDIAYCVQPVGTITTYPNYTTSSGTKQTITVAPNTFSSVNTAIPTSTPAPAGFDWEPTFLPHAAGTREDCAWYANYSSAVPMSCQDIADEYAISIEQLLDWNPSLNSDPSNCSLQPGYSYCVVSSDAAVDTSRNDCTPINATKIVTGTAQNCNCFIRLSGTYAQSYGCAQIESEYSLTDSSLIDWNTWLSSSDCDTGLYANLDEGDYRPLCVGLNATQSIGTISAGPSGTPSPTTVTTGGTTTTVAMGPTASGEVEGCEVYHTVVDGDSCYGIETTYDITVSQFYAWNPSVGSDCTGMWLGYAYCVKGPSSAPTTTAPTSTAASQAPPAPTQSGITANCNEYYVVASGDSCAKIETQFGDTFAQLYEWNPAIGDDCQSLWPGYAICVGIASS